MRTPVNLPSNVVNDTFVDVNSTAIDQHTPNLAYSGGWSQTASNSFYIQSNTLTPNRLTDGDLAVIESGLSDFVLTSVVNPYSSGATSSYPGVVFRYVDANNFWYAFPDCANSWINVYQVNAGTSNLKIRHNVAVTSQADMTLQIRAKGVNITLWVNGQEIATYCSTFNQTATKIGVRCGKSGSPAVKQIWKSISICPFYGLNLNWPMFTKYANNPIVPLGAAGSWEDSDVNDSNVIFDSVNNHYALLYSGYHVGDPTSKQHLGNSYSNGLSLLDTWTKDAGNPVFAGGATNSLHNGGVVKLGSTYYYYYNTAGTVLNCATSTDLVTWTDYGTVLTGSYQWETGGVFDAYARLNIDGRTMEVWYGSQPADKTCRYICLATTTDGLTLTKSAKNPILAPQPFANIASNTGYGEPSIFIPPGQDGKQMLISFDGEQNGLSGRRTICQALTIDGGSTWHYRWGALEKSDTGWDNVQVFDSCTFLVGTTLYITFSGANLSGGALGLNSQLGIATAGFPYTSFVAS